MSGTTWTKFYWNDWIGDPALRLCSLQARGLWIDMLCIAAGHDPIGYVCVAGNPLGVTDLARMAGVSETEVETLVAELDRNGVFSRDRTGRVYSRRMVRDAKRLATARKNGKRGGNPTLGNRKGNSASDNPAVKGKVKTQEPDTKSQDLENPSTGFSKSGAAAPRDGSRAAAAGEKPANVIEWEAQRRALLAGQGG